MNRTFVLVSKQARANAMEAVRTADDGMEVVLKEPAKTRDQEAKYHAMFTDIARQITFDGRYMEADDWKRVMVDAFWRVTKDDPVLRKEWDRIAPRMVRSLDGTGFVQLGAQTRRFSKKLASEFIEYMHAWGADVGIEWGKKHHVSDDHDPSL